MALPTDDTRQDAQAGIQSVEVAGEILRSILVSDGPQRLSEIARGARMPAAKVHRYLVSLVRAGLCAQDPISGRYDLGPLAMQIGLQGLGRFDTLRTAAEALEIVAEQIGETAALVIWGEQGPRFVRMIEARHAQASTVPATHICPMTWSATGLLFCTYEDPGRTKGLIARELEQNRLTSRELAPQTTAELSAITARIQKAGVSTVANGGGSGIAGISAPIFDASGKLAMGMTVFGRTNRLDVEGASALVRHVCAATANISKLLGFTGKINMPAPAEPSPTARRGQRTANNRRGEISASS
jgi:DNA-binding IclR family transcriptional regulator